MFGWFKKKDLKDVLTHGHSVKVHGVVFKVRKLNPIDFASGARALQMHFDTYKTATEKQQLAALETHGDKIKEHYRDVIMACVLEPKLSRKEGEPGTIWVENLFTEWDLVTDLYLAIMEVTHGKKKLKSLISQNRAFRR
jgi:hypothetical protein